MSFEGVKFNKGEYGLNRTNATTDAVMALVDYPALTGLDPRTTLAIALGLIALGAGGIKPCVSAHVGDQFGMGVVLAGNSNNRRLR